MQNRNAKADSAPDKAIGRANLAKNVSGNGRIVPDGHSEKKIENNSEKKFNRGYYSAADQRLEIMGRVFKFFECFHQKQKRNPTGGGH